MTMVENAMSHSQNSNSHMGEDYQSRYNEGSMTQLIQSSAAVLENECLNLEKECQKKNEELLQLNEKCATQAENISKQRLDLEHLKLMTHSEVMNRESCLNKITLIREKAQVLNGYLSESYCKNINLMVTSKEILIKVSNQIQIKNEVKLGNSKQVEQEYKNINDKVNKTVLDLKSTQEREKTEFDEVKLHLKSKLSMYEQQENKLVDELREINAGCREKEIITNLIAPQNQELKIKLQSLQEEIAMEMKDIEDLNNKLQCTLQEALAKQELLTGKLQTLDESICTTHNSLRDKEMELKANDSKHKELIAAEDEFCEVKKKEMETMSVLQVKAESMQEESSILLGIKEENSNLKQKCQDLENELKYYESKICEVKELEKDLKSELDALDKVTEDFENKNITVINEKQVILDKIKVLQKNMENNEDEHKKISHELNQPYAELLETNEALMASVDDLENELSEAHEDEEDFTRCLEDLKLQCKTAKLLSEESYFKLFEEREMIINKTKELKEEYSYLEQIISKSVTEYAQAQHDISLADQNKIDIQQIESNLNSNREAIAQWLEQEQEQNKLDIESKNEVMANSRAQYEREFRTKEQSKTEALVEVRENKARIIEVHKQNTLTEKEIMNLESNLGKCDNLVEKLQNKLQEVAQLATAEPPSQSVADYVSQSSNLLSTPKGQKRLIKPVFNSPDSDSSGRTFNPENIKIKRKPFFKAKKPMDPKQSIPIYKKKGDADDLKDCWGF